MTNKEKRREKKIIIHFRQNTPPVGWLIGWLLGGEFCSFSPIIKLSLLLTLPNWLWDCFLLRVPKELISRFVKICPTCQVRRGSHLSPPDSRRNSPPMEPSRTQQQQQAPSAYLRTQQPPPSPTAYDGYRRKSSSSSSFGYSDRNREPKWTYPSPGSRHSEMAWSAASHHQHHIRQPPHMDNGGGGGSSQSGRYPSISSSSSSSTNMKLGNLHIDSSSPPSPTSESMVETSSSQAQYGYIPSHANSRYRPGYWLKIPHHLGSRSWIYVFN